MGLTLRLHALQEGKWRVHGSLLPLHGGIHVVGGVDKLIGGAQPRFLHPAGKLEDSAALGECRLSGKIYASGFAFGCFSFLAGAFFPADFLGPASSTP